MELGNVPRVVYSGARNKTANISHASGYHFRCREVNIPLSFCLSLYSSGTLKIGLIIDISFRAWESHPH
jgi:hypothetical protein